MLEGSHSKHQTQAQINSETDEMIPKQKASPSISETTPCQHRYPEELQNPPGNDSTIKAATHEAFPPDSQSLVQKGGQRPCQKTKIL